MRHTRQGFTLIELLVVVAIIAILAAILFPVFARAREKAYQATCLSNMKQITLTTLQYCYDYDGYGPSRIDGDKLYAWNELLGGYGMPWLTKDGKIHPAWKCESAGRTSYYSMCSNRAGDYVNGSHKNWDQTKCLHPTDIVMVSECGIEYHPSKPALYCNLVSIRKPKGDWSAWVYTPISTAHGDGNIEGFFDGHAKWCSLGWIDANWVDMIFYWWK